MHINIWPKWLLFKIQQFQKNNYMKLLGHIFVCTNCQLRNMPVQCDGVILNPFILYVYKSPFLITLFLDIILKIENILRIKMCLKRNGKNCGDKMPSLTSLSPAFIYILRILCQQQKKQ